MQFLGFPKKDPHGDPIPDKEGKFQKIEKKIVVNVRRKPIREYVLE